MKFDRRSFLSMSGMTALLAWVGAGVGLAVERSSVSANAKRLGDRRLSDLRRLTDPGVPGAVSPYAAEYVSAEPEYARAVEYGRIPYRGVNGVELWANVEIKDEDVATFLRADAEAHLPPNTRYEIRKAAPSDGTSFGKPCAHAQREVGRHKMAWYRCEQDWSRNCTDKIENFGQGPFGPQPNGYVLVGQFTTPAQSV